MQETAMRIAYLVTEYPKVSHTFIRREILALERRGFEIERIALRGWKEILVDDADERERKRTRYVLADGVLPLLWAVLRLMFIHPLRFLNALAIAWRMAMPGARRPLLYHLAYLAEACRILPWLQSFGARHIHAHFATNSTEIVMLVHALGGPPYSFTFHGLEEALAAGIAEKIQRCKFAVTVSSYQRSQLYLHSDPELWPKIQLVHCGIDSHFRDESGRLGTDARRLVCVARLSPEKGHFVLLEAARLLVERGQKFQLVFAGDGELRPSLEERINAYGLSERVKITGWLSADGVRNELKAARGLVLASFAEGLPIVIMEAMAMRRPILATLIGGIPELVQHGQHGWLVPAGSATDLATAMEEFLNTPAESLEQMGEKAYHRVLERHDIDREIERLARLFRETGSPERNQVLK